MPLKRLDPTTLQAEWEMRPSWKMDDNGCFVKMTEAERSEAYRKRVQLLVNMLEKDRR